MRKSTIASCEKELMRNFKLMPKLLAKKKMTSLLCKVDDVRMLTIALKWEPKYNKEKA